MGELGPISCFLAYVLADNLKREREELSDRQAQCLALASKGMTSKEIGREIGISPSTVDNHLRIAAAKLQVGGRRQAIRQMASSTGYTEALIEDSPRTFSPEKPPRTGFLPPVGGSVNTLPASTRLAMVVRISLLGTMALGAITTTISGIVSILSR